MSSIKSANKFLEELYKIVPHTKSDLHYKNIFELLVAVILSAQTTDNRVNIVTKTLFEKYPDPHHLANADIEDVSNIISSLGLYRNKSKNIIMMSKSLVADFNGYVPNTREQLLTLPGVGRKTANVVLSEGFKKPAIAVDTHVTRVSQRLQLADSKDVLDIELQLQDFFPEDKWGQAHILLVHFGRYVCKAKKPLCNKCPFTEDCLYYRQIKTKKTTL